MTFLSYPIPVPDSEGNLAKALEKLDRELAAGKNVVLHCRQGIGRAGLVAACLLLTKGIDAENRRKAFERRAWHIHTGDAGAAPLDRSLRGEVQAWRSCSHVPLAK